MKQPKIFFKNKIYDVHSISWYKDGKMSNISAFDKERTVITIFEGNPEDDLNKKFNAVESLADILIMEG